MQTQQAKPLLIYSASAGSGKTFSLVQHYLKLTIGEGALPQNFSKVLAMTFTNKAAWEMKERIIQALDYLAFPIRENEKETKRAEKLLDATILSVGLPAEKIQENSKRVLAEILHHYEDFNVLTIDKFSLRLIRTFSRDLELNENFEVTLDQDYLLEQVIDELLSKIGKPEEKEITKLTVSYAKSKLHEGDSWNFRQELIQFSKILTQETDQAYVEKLLVKEFTNDSYSSIVSELDNLTQQHTAKAEEIYNYFLSLHTDSGDYPQGNRGIFKWLNELPQRKLLDYRSPNNYVLNTLSGEIVNPDKHNVDGRLVSLCEDFLQFEQQLYSRAYTLNLIKLNFYNLSLLKYISKELNQYKERENLIGIYEFGQKISELLKRENAPYIYERLGNRYNHYLLDEFQDTSRLQWMNLVPLVHESIGHGYENLIVGDPKQAIYRFRNGLVEQFVALPEIYNPENENELSLISNFFKKMGEKKVLASNYRSAKNVVTFNNRFFTHLIQTFGEDYKAYYQDIHQIPAGSDGGVVQIHLFDPKAEKIEPIDKESKFLLEKVEAILADGYNPGDICVLTRNKKEGKEYARLLTEANYKVVSSDSLSVDSDVAVAFCIDYLQLRKNQNNRALQLKFANSYFRIKQKEPLAAFQTYWRDEKVGNFDFIRFVKQEFDSLEKLFFPYENLFDLGTRFIALFGFGELNNPYLHHLMNLFQEYDLKNGPDIQGFLEEWAFKLHKSAVLMPENDRAIKLMTIHKSKGLEFPIVILPRLSWGIRPSRGEHFIESDDGELFYANLKKDNVPNYMSSKYDEEYKRALLDELNVLYVALTRPVERLYMLVEAAASKSEYKSRFDQILYPVLSAWEDEIITQKTKEIIQIGEEIEKTTSVATASTSQAFIPKDLGEFLWFPDLALQDSEALENESFETEKVFGIQLHLVFSELERKTSIKTLVKQFVQAGKIEARWEDEIVATVTKVKEFLAKQSFVQHAEEVISEQDILINDAEFVRPDKIYIQGDKATVLDFKSGEPTTKNKKQVIGYCHQLRMLGYKEVEGYLLYTKTMNLLKVAP